MKKLAAVIYIFCVSCDGAERVDINEVNPLQICSGNACSVIQIQKRSGDGCIIVRNSGARSVEFRHNRSSISMGTVYAGSEMVLFSISGACMKDFEHDYTANYL